jgi:hypothetical protein
MEDNFWAFYRIPNRPTAVFLIRINDSFIQNWVLYMYRRWVKWTHPRVISGIGPGGIGT